MSIDDPVQIQSELEKIEAALQSLASLLSGEQLATAQKPLLEHKAALLQGSGAIAQGENSTALGQGAVKVDGNVGGDVVTGVKIEQYATPPGHQPLPLPEALKRYLDHLIAAHQHLRLQGIRAGSQPLSVALEKVYVSLTALDQRVNQIQPPSGQARASENPKVDDLHGASGMLTVAAALQCYRRLVIIGDPGCGKTTLLSYLALTYARAHSSNDTVQARLGLEESEYLPILLPLRTLGGHLRDEHPDPGQDGPSILMKYLHAYFSAQQIALPVDFFDAPLESGEAVLLLDGMDEVADVKTRQRIARLIEKFVIRYPRCRCIVTSREIGYEGAARIGETFGLAKVRPFSPTEVRQFVRDWTVVVETTLTGETPEIIRLANAQADKLIQAIESNARVAELAVNPLLLTVIALVHRYRAQLPERRSELYEEAVEVLLGHWDEAKDGMPDDLGIAGIKLDSGDRRCALEPVAFWLHERERRELDLADLRPLLLPTFQNMAADAHSAEKAIEAFIQRISERSGLLVERGQGVYGFAHLTFQEYLAARALADRADALKYSLLKLPDPWWREVILLEAGYLSTQGKRRVSELICAILEANSQTETEPFHHLLLAAECLFDVGPARVEGDLLGEARRRLQIQAELPIKKGDKGTMLRKITAINALARLESGQITSQYWKEPWGEPDWVTIPAGEFWMGSEKGDRDEKPVHRLSMPEFQIGRVPVTNAQYALFVADSGQKPPEYWRGGGPPKGLENHPVVSVSWKDALAYCGWLCTKIDRGVSLPSEAEWEYAAKGDIARRGPQEQHEYPWGKWDELHCNTDELGLGNTTPVGLFLNGASPYGVLDMSGNVFEWTRSVFRNYPSVPDDRCEDAETQHAPRVLRGGSFYDFARLARCAYRYRHYPDYCNEGFGFRVVVSHTSRHSGR